MDVPQIFISSTCYDLNEVRRQLENFIGKELGYEPVMSDTASFKVGKRKNSLDVCFDLIPECHFFVLIIGNRYGSKMERENKSITNKEYEVAAKNGLLIYPFVKKDVWNALQIYNQNIGKDIKYPFIDNLQLFEFINEVQTASKDNFIWTFENADDITDVLRKQFAYVVNDLLNNEMRVHSDERHIEGRNKCIVALRLGWLLRQIMIFLPLGGFDNERIQKSLHFINEILYGYKLFAPDNNDDEVVEFQKIKQAILDGSFFKNRNDKDFRDGLIRLHLNQMNLEQELKMRLSGVYQYYFMLGHTLAQINLSLVEGRSEHGGSDEDLFKMFRNQIDTCLKNLNLPRELENRIHRITDSLNASSTYDEYFLEAQMIIQQTTIYLES